MNFDVSPMQSASSPIAALALLPGASPADDFAALLDRSAAGAAAPVQNTATGDTIAVTPGPASNAFKDGFVTLLPQVPVDAVAVKGDMRAATEEPAAALVAIAKADALVARLSPGPKTPEEPAAPSEEKPVPSVLADPARFAAPADLLKSERKGIRHEGRPAADEQLDDSEAGEAPQSAPAASEATTIASAQISSPLVAVLSPVGQPASRPIPENAISLVSSTRSKMPSPTAEKSNEAISQEALLPGELPRTRDKVTTSFELPNRALKANSDSAATDAPELELSKILSALAPSEGKEISAPKSAPVRAAKIAEIALGLADAQPVPDPIAVQSGKPELSAAVTSDIAPSSAPARGTVVERQLDLIRNEQWLGELAHDIASTTGDTNRLSFRLMPHQLGRLDVDVSRSHNGLSLSIQTESDSAKAILSAAQPRLADEIRSQGIKLADTQMFSGDARQSPGQDGFTRPAPLIETFISPNETVDAPEQEQRDGRYA